MALLGPVALWLDGEPVGLVSAKARGLLVYLAVNGRSYSRAALANLLWSDLPEADARRNLRVELLKLRQAVGDYMVADAQTVAFDTTLPYWLDVAEFERQREDVAGWQTAVSLHRGDFLEDLYVRQAPVFEEWLEAERARLRLRLLDLHWRLAETLAGQGEVETAVFHARQLLHHDPTREAAHRMLMTLLARQGQRSAAIAQYEQCRTLLATELGLTPSPETTALADQIRHNTLPSTPHAPRPTPYTNLQSPISSPFIAGPPITNPRHFFGRERIVRRLFGLLRQRPLQNAAIIGPRRSGKTSLLHYLRQITTAVSPRPDQRTDWLPQPSQYRWVFVDFQDPRLGELAGLLRHLLLGMGLPVPEPCILETFLDVVADELRQPTIVLLDEIGVALSRYPELDDTFWESLRSLATNQVGGNLAFILTAPERPDELAAHSGYGSPFFNIFGYAATLGPLDEDEARVLIASSPRPFAAEDVAWLLQKSGRWPMPLQILCRERLLALEEGEEDWQTEAWAQAAPFVLRENIL